MTKKFQGLIAATFTPMFSDGTINSTQIKPMTDYLISQKIAGFYVCGSTGEGPLMTGRERKEVAEAYIRAVDGRIPVIVQVGHDSVAEAAELAEHAAEIGADAIASVAPSYFKCTSVQSLVQCMAQIARSAPDIPFFYYHIPAITGANVSMIEFLQQAGSEIPNLAGIKYCALTVQEFQECNEMEDGRYTMLFGVDEMMTSGLAAGACGSVGSTFNFAPALYHRLVESFNSGEIAKARQLQGISVKLCSLCYRYNGQPAFKSIMKIIGQDCGPNRLPHQNLTLEQYEALRMELEALGFFDWALFESGDPEVQRR